MKWLLMNAQYQPVQEELAKVIMNLIDGTNYGIFHIVCTGGPVSRYEYAVKLKELTGKDIEVKETARNGMHCASGVLTLR